MSPKPDNEVVHTEYVRKRLAEEAKAPSVSTAEDRIEVARSILTAAQSSCRICANGDVSFVTIPTSNITAVFNELVLALQRERAAHKAGLAASSDLLKRIRQWDHLDSAADGAFWKSEIDKLLRATPAAPEEPRT